MGMTYFEWFQNACTVLVVIVIWCNVVGYLASGLFSQSKDDNFFELPD